MKKKTTKEELTVEPADISGKIVSDVTLGIEDADVIEPEVIEEDEDWGDNHPNFIESNTSAITLEELETKCIVPCFATNELTLSHQEIAKNLYEAAAEVYGLENLGPLEFRVSHPIKGRNGSQEAINKKSVSELDSNEITVFYQRIACCFKVKTLSKNVCGQETNFCIGFIRSYHTTNLYSGKSGERVSLYCGQRVRLCSNLCLTLSGLRENLLCLTGMDVKEHALKMFESYSATADDDVKMLEDLGQTRITPFEFCTLIGRLRYYLAMDTASKKALPKIDLGDQLCNEATRLFVNSHWGLQEDETDVDMFRVLQCFNEAAKSSYIHNFLTKNVQCTELCLNISKVLQGDQNNPYSWFLN